MAAWFVLLSDVGGAYQQKGLAMFSATVGCGFAVLLASVLEKFFEAQVSEAIRVRDEIEPMLTVVNFARRLILTLAALDEHVRGFPGGGQLAGLGEFAKETSERLRNLAETLAGSAGLEGNRDLDWRLAEMQDQVDRLGETRLGEFAQNVKRELTSTAVALREQFLILAQLQRIAAHVTVLDEAVARLKPAGPLLASRDQPRR